MLFYKYMKALLLSIPITLIFFLFSSATSLNIVEAAKTCDMRAVTTGQLPRGQEMKVAIYGITPPANYRVSVYDNTPPNKGDYLGEATLRDTVTNRQGATIATYGFLPLGGDTAQNLSYNFQAIHNNAALDESCDQDVGTNVVAPDLVLTPTPTPTPAPDIPPPYKYEIAKCGDLEGVNSAIGCIPTENLTETMKFILRFIFGAAGGIIVLMIIKMGYDIMTSAGDPNKITAVRERLVSIFSGLVLIVFSFVLLKTIGVDILGLPGFTP